MKIKKCSQCNKTKPVSAFRRDGNRASGHTQKCISCLDYFKEYRRQNREQTNALCDRKHAEYKRGWLNALRSKFGSLSCSRCGFDEHFEAVDFHHTGPKTDCLSYLFRYKPTEERLREIEDGILLCKNCHALLHAGVWNLQ